MNVTVIYSSIAMKETEHFNPSADLKGEETDVDYTKQFGLFTRNKWNCEIIHEVEPKSDDIILPDRCDFSAFTGTGLESYLKGNNVKHFFIT
eukprot:13361230-Ditylum_brightwellii.AAC.1